MKVDAIKRFVLDASVTLAWCFPEERAKYPDAVLDLLSHGAEAFAPAIWPFEVANALLAGEKRQRVTVAQVTSMLGHIARLPISLHPVPAVLAFTQILPLARQTQLTEYGASYLELGLRLGLPLATLDVQLHRAAKSVGLPLLRI
jgi:predicted nucleic acid-binding protein